MDYRTFSRQKHHCKLLVDFGGIVTEKRCRMDEDYEQEDFVKSHRRISSAPSESTSRTEPLTVDFEERTFVKMHQSRRSSNMSTLTDDQTEYIDKDCRMLSTSERTRRDFPLLRQKSSRTLDLQNDDFSDTEEEFEDSSRHNVFVRSDSIHSAPELRCMSYPDCPSGTDKPCSSFGEEIMTVRSQYDSRMSDLEFEVQNLKIESSLRKSRISTLVAERDELRKQVNQINDWKRLKLKKIQAKAERMSRSTQKTETTKKPENEIAIKTTEKATSRDLLVKRYSSSYFDSARRLVATKVVVREENVETPKTHVTASRKERINDLSSENNNNDGRIQRGGFIGIIRMLGRTA